MLSPPPKKKKDIILFKHEINSDAYVWISALVGSYVWSHLFNIQKTEDPLKRDLMESLPHDIISKDFEAEPWKYSSHMDFTMDTGIPWSTL